MKNAILILMTVLVMLALTNCASVRVAVNYNGEADFSAYKTFAFVKQQHRDGKTIKNPLFNKDVLREIRPVLEEKGFTEASSPKEADMLVIFYASIQHHRDFIAPTYHVGRWGRVWRTSPGHVVHYKEGTLVIDIVDRIKKELVWQGVGKDVLNNSNPQENIVEAVREILKDFPPQL